MKIIFSKNLKRTSNFLTKNTSLLIKGLFAFNCTFDPDQRRQRPHIGLQHLRQLSMALLFLQPFRTVQLRCFRGTFNAGPDATLGPVTLLRRRSISGWMRFIASVRIKSHPLILRPVSLLKSIQTRSRMLQMTAIGQRC